MLTIQDIYIILNTVEKDMEEKLENVQKTLKKNRKCKIAEKIVLAGVVLSSLFVTASGSSIIANDILESPKVSQSQRYEPNGFEIAGLTTGTAIAYVTLGIHSATVNHKKRKEENLEEIEQV